MENQFYNHILLLAHLQADWLDLADFLLHKVREVDPELFVAT